MKKSFSLLEILIVILLLTILYTLFTPKTNYNKLNEVTNRLLLNLKQTRYQSLIDNQFNTSDDYWHKRRWTLKFFRCRESVGGIYYSIYKNKNKSGHPSSSDSLKDSLSNKNIYSSNQCKENNLNSKYVLLTKNFEIKKVVLSCNETTSLGQLSFAYDGNIFNKLSNNSNSHNEFLLNEECKIDLYDIYDNKSSIIIESKTGFIYKI